MVSDHPSPCGSVALDSMIPWMGSSTARICSGTSAVLTAFAPGACAPAAALARCAASSSSGVGSQMYSPVMALRLCWLKITVISSFTVGICSVVVVGGPPSGPGVVVVFGRVPCVRSVWMVMQIATSGESVSSFEIPQVYAPGYFVGGCENEPR